MVAPLVIFTAAAVMTLKSDTNPVKVYVKKPRGTLYWGGAGLDGPYVKPQLAAFQKVGIQHISVGLTNSATQFVGTRFGSLIDAFRSGAIIRFEFDSEWVIESGMSSIATQFNLIGYSYGSLLAAQTANFYANQGHIVDHLVLIGSPIDADFLAKLKSHKNIKSVIVINLTEHGDHIYAGMTELELLNCLSTLQSQQDRQKGEGHFYYAHVTPDSQSRWDSLAHLLFDQGIR